MTRKFLQIVLMYAVLSCALLYTGTVQAAEITVSAAASLREAFTTMQQEFQKQYPDIKVNTNFAASNPLLKQLQEGAPVDVFASADQETMDKAAQSKVIVPESRKDFALNALVLVAPPKSAVTKTEDLRQPSVKRIAVGNPDSVPAGRYTRDALQSLQLWEVLKPKMVMGESVRQVLDYVSRGEVDAGFVYRTDAVHSAPKTEIRATMSGHKPIVYPIAVAANNANDKAKQGAAQDFVNFVCSAKGQAILAKYGFSAISK